MPIQKNSGLHFEWQERVQHLAYKAMFQMHRKNRHRTVPYFVYGNYKYVNAGVLIKRQPGTGVPICYNIQEIKLRKTLRSTTQLTVYSTEKHRRQYTKSNTRHKKNIHRVTN